MEAPASTRPGLEAAATSSGDRSLAFHIGTSTLEAPLPTPAYFWLFSPGGRYCLGESLYPECTEHSAPPFPTPHPKFLRGQRAPTLLSRKRKLVHFSRMKVAWGDCILQILPTSQHSPNVVGRAPHSQASASTNRQDFSLCTPLRSAL